MKDFMWTEIPGENIHVIPVNDKNRPPHIESQYCWCGPTLTYKDEVTKKEVWTHKGYEELDQ